MKGELGEEIRKNIQKTGGVSHFSMKNGRCAFLCEDNLCRIIKELGDGGLCHICREHPRFYSYLSGVTLGGVGMSCEAAAELILKQEWPSLYGDIIPLLDKDDEDFEISSRICRTLLSAENVLCSDDLSDGEKICRLFEEIASFEKETADPFFARDEECGEFILPTLISDLFSKADEKTDGSKVEPSAVENVRKRLPTLEFMSDKLEKKLSEVEWSKVKAAFAGSPSFRRILFNALGYLVLRYVPKADGDFSPYSFIFSSIVILSLLIACAYPSADVQNGSLPDEVFSEIVRLAVLYSEEIEYSEENVLALGE